MQNIYDNDTFFAGYQQLRDTGTGLNEAIEQPALLAMLPPLAGLSVLDLGSGFGDFARWAAAQGAAQVLGLELSGRMIETARQRTQDPRIAYRQAGIEDAELGQGAWDLVTASLVLHYIEDFAAVARKVRQALKPGGLFVFSVEHPVCTAAYLPWVRDAQGQPQHWPLARYAEEGRRETDWFVHGVLKYHRTVSTYLNGVVASGFSVQAVGEPGPTAQALQARPELAQHLQRPPFLLLLARAV